MSEDELQQRINCLIVEAYKAAGVPSPGDWQPDQGPRGFPRMRGVLMRAVALGRHLAEAASAAPEALTQAV